jgi:predicted helicase
MYQKYPKVTDIFKIYSVGIVTARDNLTIKWTSEEMWHTILTFSKMESELARLAYNLDKDARDWKVELAQKDLLNSGMKREKIIPILYRPFDVRYTYYTGRSRGFNCMPRLEVMRHMLQENLGLITIRRSRSPEKWKYALATDKIITGATAITSLDINYLFPLYIYTEKLSGTVEEHEGKEKLSNINPEFMKALIENYKTTPAPEEIFYYIYSILYSNIYRMNYAEFLKTDFPRIPFTKNHTLFIELGKYGKRLADLHLLKSEELNTPFAKFQGTGNNRVEKVAFQLDKVYVNSNQYFEGVEKNVWEYQIGGYQVLDKWLKDRKGRVLSLDDIKNYCKIVYALKRTIEVQEELDIL